ncbi:MAG: putative ABC exporter domain-containing protein [Armatimonadota bacterium]
MRPLLYLEYRQLINSIKNLARHPKRLIPAILIIAWITSWMMQGAITFSDNDKSSLTPNLNVISFIPIELIHTIVFITLCVGTFLVIYGAFSSSILAFTIAHIDFLFPTPVKRKYVLLTKLIKDYLKYFLWVGFFFIVIGLPTLNSIGVNFFPLGIVSIISTSLLMILVVNISHTLNIIYTFGFEKLKQSGLIFKIVLVVLFSSILIISIVEYIFTGDSFAGRIMSSDSIVVRTIFAPIGWTTDLILSPLLGITDDGYNSLFWLFVISFISFLVLISRKENVYEPSLGISVKTARRQNALKYGDIASIRLDEMREKGVVKPDGFSITPFGVGAIALFWKYLIQKYRISKKQIIFMVAIPFLAMYLITVFAKTETAIRAMQYMPIILLYIVWILSITVHAELGSELRHANIIKSMPIAPWKVMLAQISGGTFYITFGTLFFALAMVVVIPQTRNEYLLASLSIAPSLCFVSISAMTLAGILYPNTGDVAQNYISGMVGFVFISLAAFPTMVLIIFYQWLPIFTLPIQALTIIIANLLYAGGWIALSGIAFKKYDPTSA